MNLTSKDLERAIIYASEKHKGQVRKGNSTPYILHPLRVMFILMNIKASKNIYLLAISCAAHDLIEDTDTTIQDIANEFGYNVASIVEELTSDKEAIKEKGKEVYLLDKMLKMSSYALCIKLCDRLDNVSDMKDMSDEFREKTINQTNYILNGLFERKLTNTHKKIIKEIRKVISKY